MQLLIGHGQVPTIMPEASKIFYVALFCFSWEPYCYYQEFMNGIKAVVYRG